MNPSKHNYTVLKQICKVIPRKKLMECASKYGVDEQARSFSPWSHICSLIYAQLSHAMSLNDVCDALRNHSGVLTTMSNMTAPSRNGFSHANRTRNADMAEELFWGVLNHVKSLSPSFGKARNYFSIPRRFKRAINAVDSTTIQLFANCLDWAKHRRRKAAAKMHLTLDLQGFLPRFVIVKTAKTHDSAEAKQLCMNIRAGEIVVFDKAYVDYKHLHELSNRGVFWVSRAKSNMNYKPVGQHTAPKGKILRDVIIKLTGIKAEKYYPDKLRLVEALVEIDGKERPMTFITNNFEWAASSIAELYKARWAIETFFKEIKQTLQISDFLGYNENAVRWQVWTALLTYILLRFIKHISRWTGSFTRIFTLLRGVLWSRLDMFSVLESCGTASGRIRLRGAPEQAYLPGFIPLKGKRAWV